MAGLTTAARDAGDKQTGTITVSAAERTAAAPPVGARGAAVDLRGPARLGRRTKELTQRLEPGAVVIVSHADMDALAARALLAARPVAVINCDSFVTGRYPNRGPDVLVAAGIPLFEVGDLPAPDLFALLTDGEAVAIKNNALSRVAAASVAPITLLPLTRERLEARLADARTHLNEALTSFAENTMRYLGREEERALLLDPVVVPDLRTAMAGRPALVVVRGDGYEEDLRRLGPYLREQRPVVIAVDGAADTLLAQGIRPDIILGDMDSVRDATLRCGAELVVHAYTRTGADPDEAAPGLPRLRTLALTSHVFPVAGTSEDAALLLAYEKGADLIVAVGTHTNLEDFLDKGRGGMASTFLVRLKVGSRLVDARGVSRLYTGKQKIGGLLAFLALSALFPVFVLLAGTPPGQVAWRAIVLWFHVLLHR